MRKPELDERMTAESWSRIEALFDEAMTLPAARREAWLSERTATDEWLQRHVRRLLEQVEVPDALLDRPAAESVQREALLAELSPGTRIGAWRLGALVGRGGLGEVYRVERADGAFVQQAALKLIRREAVDQIERFHEERRVLARLDHPGIARLVDGGLASDGRPYLVMEWLEGTSLTQWCSERNLPLAQRLDLFLQVCEAVAYAHRNLLVHRDLKPANVRVTPEGRCKLLDFGVAKFLRDGGIDETRTQAPMTLAYASPEQLAQEPVAPASDVYSLGLLLFELLTGERPWHRSQSLPLLIERQMRADAPAPSRIAAGLADAPIEARRLRGDLDAITGFALRREPERRYRSAAELADDLRRHLEGRPVLARPESLAYSLQRFASRNHVAAGFAGLAIAALAVGFATALWQAREARAAAEAAQHEAARATATKQFLVNVFRAGDPRIAQDKPRGQITAKELLDINAQKIGEEFRDDPATQIELLGTTASIYRELGDDARYRALVTQQLQQVRRLYGDSHPAFIQGLLDDAHHANNEDEYVQALKLLDQADPLIRKAGLDNTVTRARWWLIRSDVLKENRDEADPGALDKALAMYERLAPTDPGFVKALTTLGWREMRGSPAKSEQHFLRAIAIAEKTPENNDSELQQLTWPGLAQVREDQGKYEEAIQAYDRGAALIEKTYGARHNTAWVPTAQYASTLHRHGLRERALAQFDKLMAVIPRDWTENSYDEYAREFYADRLVAEGRPLLAIPLLEAALRTYREKPSVEYEVRRNLLILGDAYDRAGMWWKARDAIKASLDERLQKEPAGSASVSVARERWGRFLLAHNDLPGAQTQFDEVLVQTKGHNNEMAVLAYGGLARLAQERHDWEAALRSSTHAVVGFENLAGRRDVRTGPYLWLIHAESLRRVDDAASSRIWAQRALEASKRYDAPHAPSIRDAEKMLALIGRQNGDRPEALAEAVAGPAPVPAPAVRPTAPEAPEPTKPAVSAETDGGIRAALQAGDTEVAP